MTTKSYKVKGKDIGNMMITVALQNIVWERVNRENDCLCCPIFSQVDLRKALLIFL